MRHIKPNEILRARPQLIVERPTLFIPGLSPAPKLIGAQREINPGSASWTSPGTYNWTLPFLFNNLFITCLGAGGGGSGACYATANYTYIYLPPDPPYGEGSLYNGGAGTGGGYGQFYLPSTGLNMVAYGGAGGPGGSTEGTTSPMAAGAHGQGYNGNSSNFYGSGSAGGTYGYDYVTLNDPYGFERYKGYYSGYRYGGYGGNGGRCDSHFTIGQIPSSTVATIVVQSGGSPGYQAAAPSGAYPTYGGVAGVYVSWN